MNEKQPRGPIDDKILQFYDKNPQREWERLFVDQAHQVEYYVTLHHLGKHLPPTGSRVLDVGGGPGRYTIELAGRGYKMTLVDISVSSLQFAKAKVAEQKVGDNVEEVTQADVRNLSSFPDNSFDSILVLGGVLSHLLKDEDRAQAITELSRVGKPNAPIFVSVMSRLGEVGNRLYRNPEDVEQIEQFLVRGDHLRPETGVFTYTHFYTPEELKELLVEGGLEPLELTSLQSFASPLRDHVNNLPPDLFWKWVDTFINLSQDPSVLGISSHFMSIARNKKSGSGEEWVGSTFDTKNGLYEKIFVPSPEETEAETRFIINFVSPKQNDQIIDVCSGSGRHMLSLAKQGFHVDGLDISPVSVAQAKKAMDSLPSNVYLTDVRQLPQTNPELVGRYELAINMFSSFGYYENDGEQLALLKGIRSILKPNGRLLLDLPNKEFVLQSFAEVSEFSQAGLVVRVDRQYDAKKSRIYTKTHAVNGETEDVLDVAMNLYSIEDISELLAQAGFVIEKVARDFTGGVFDPHDPSCKRMLILTRKV